MRTSPSIVQNTNDGDIKWDSENSLKQLINNNGRKFRFY